MEETRGKLDEINFTDDDFPQTCVIRGRGGDGANKRRLDRDTQTQELLYVDVQTNTKFKKEEVEIQATPSAKRFANAGTGDDDYYDEEENQEDEEAKKAEALGEVM